MAVKKTKNRDYYKAGKFKSVQWSAKVTNDTTKKRATLSFKKDFNQAAKDLRTKKTEINKQFNIITKQINRIKKDPKTGELIKKSLTSQLNAYETARKAFLKETADLYNNAISTYNDWMQSIYESLMASMITNQGTETNVIAENISVDDDADTQA